MNHQSERSILVVGWSDTGKTLYGTQLFGRLREGGFALSLRRAPESYTLFEEALDSLNQGVPPLHTTAKVHEEVPFPVTGPDGIDVTLVWPDYGGEQILNILEARRVPSRWRRRIVDANAWLLFVRPAQLRDFKDIITRPLTDLVAARQHEAKERSGDDLVLEWSHQATLIELLQLLLEVKSIPAVRRVSMPPLGVALTCWDEVADEAGTDPERLLRQRLPLLAEFIDARWTPEAWFTFGLSSQGRSLSDEVPDEDYINEGPTAFGYVIMPGEEPSPDLSLPVVELLRRTS